MGTFVPGGPAFNTSMAGGGGAPPRVTQPRTAPTTNSVIPSTQAGPFVTSMGALTSCPSTTMGGAFPNIPLTGSLACVTGTGPLLSGPGNTGRTATGFPFTTGTVLVQWTTNTMTLGLHTISGSDARTARGVGNISLVAGGLATNTFTMTASRQVSRIDITFSEKAPSITPGGIAAAAVLMVLAVGFTLRKRF